MVLRGRAIWGVSSTILPLGLRPGICGLLVVGTMQTVDVLLGVDSMLEMRVQFVTWKRASIIVLVRRRSNLVGQTISSVIRLALPRWLIAL